MKVKYRQLYSNECGLCALKNFLTLNKIKKPDFTLKYDTNGTSLEQMRKVLKKYFNEVEVISFDLNQLKHVKNFTPFICLIKKSGISHYLVIYKKNKKYLYILDSLAKKSYKLTYQKFLEFEIVASIVATNIKKISLNFFQFKWLLIMPILAIFEAIFMLSTTILLQQIIDNGYKNALLYLFAQAFLIIITAYKCRLFLKSFREIDKSIIGKTLNSIYHLKKSYLDKYDIDEVYYRLNDAYAYKNMILAFAFNVINDLILTICSLALMFVYSYILTLLVLLACLIVVFIAIKVFIKSKDIIEKRRISEYTFFNDYRDSFTSNNPASYLKKSQENLLKFQCLDYCYEKINMIKNLIFLSFQTMMISLIVILYFTSFYEIISIGSLVALINLVSIVLAPILNLCSEITMFSNIKLIHDRLKDISDNQK